MGLSGVCAVQRGVGRVLSGDMDDDLVLTFLAMVQVSWLAIGMAWPRFVCGLIGSVSPASCPDLSCRSAWGPSLALRGRRVPRARGWCGPLLPVSSGWWAAVR